MAGKDRRFDAKKLKILGIIKNLILIAAIVFVVFRFVIGVSAVSGESMLDTYEDGQLVVYSRLFRSVERGDVVSVAIPSGEYYIKRVLAVGGDTVDLRDGVLYINGEAEQGDYIRGETIEEDAPFGYPYVVNPGEIFVVGDNREVSIDSRYFGSLGVNKVQGVIKFALG